MGKIKTFIWFYGFWRLYKKHTVFSSLGKAFLCALSLKVFLNPKYGILDSLKLNFKKRG